MVHIHIGYENPNIGFSTALVKYMDMFVGVPSVVYDHDTRRRKYYGNAGSFRLTSYGVEYRVLSGYWLQSADTLSYIHKQTVKAVEAALRANKLPSPEDVINIINNTDSEAAIKAAKKLISKFKLEN